MTAPLTADARFEALQQKLVPLWRSIDHISQDPQTIVVVPSISLESTIQGARQQAYEERFLFLLLLLRQPRARLVYVTSQAIHPDIVDYYLDLLPGVISVHAKKRLFLVTPLDGSARPLTQKLLERPQILRHIRSLVADPNRAHLVPFNTTTLERDLALQLGIPMYGADPRFLTFGTKSGSRRIFAEAGVSHPVGIEGLQSIDDLVAAIADLRARKPSLREVIVKLDEGVSVKGTRAWTSIDCRGRAAWMNGPQSSRVSRRCGSSSRRLSMPTTRTSWSNAEASSRSESSGQTFGARAPSCG